MTRGRDESGQATVELALVLPLVALVLLALVQAVVVARDQLLVVHAAREAAREAAVNDDPTAATTAAREAGPLDPAQMSVEIRGRDGPGSTVEAVVSYRPPNHVPILTRLLGNVTLHGRAKMRVER
jgi:Flp pilus assembly protein TadG